MPRNTSRTSTNGRSRQRNARGSGTGAVVTQITQLVAANETLQRENRELAEANVRLRAELTEIGSALGRLTGAPKGRGRRGAAPFALPEAKPRQTRRRITDPEQLERRRAALAKARAARSEKLAAAREAVAASQ